jgi:hypothetical protein
MQDQQTVTVHGFRLYGSHIEDFKVANFKATREVIAALGGEPLLGTEQTVPRSELDRHGRYRRVATGWGELAD